MWQDIGHVIECSISGCFTVQPEPSTDSSDMLSVGMYRLMVHVTTASIKCLEPSAFSAALLVYS